MPQIIAISGSLRRRSSNTMLLRTLASVAPADVQVVLYDGLHELPHFNPDLDPEEETLRELRQVIAALACSA